MDQYKRIYQQYIMIMTKLKSEMDSIIITTPDGSRKNKAFYVASLIDKTINSATIAINIPSDELYEIVKEVLELESCGAIPIAPVQESLNLCYTYLKQAIDTLSKMTDDVYVSKSKEMLSIKQ